MIRILTLPLIFQMIHCGHLNAKEELVGEWSGGSRTTPHGFGAERRPIFAEQGGRLSLTFKHLKFTGLRNEPEERLYGPYRVKKRDSNRIIYVVDENEYHVTWRINPNGALEWGAIVSDDNLKWHFAREVPIPELEDSTDDGPLSLKISRGFASWSFLADPFKVPVGEARIPGLQAGYAYYVHEKLPSYTTGSLPRKSIRVMTLNEDGSLSEQFRMVWNQSAGPYLEGVFSRGENLSTIITSVFRRIDQE